MLLLHLSEHFAALNGFRGGLGLWGLVPVLGHVDGGGCFLLERYAVLLFQGGGLFSVHGCAVLGHEPLAEFVKLGGDVVVDFEPVRVLRGHDAVDQRLLDQGRVVIGGTHRHQRVTRHIGLLIRDRVDLEIFRHDAAALAGPAPPVERLPDVLRYEVHIRVQLLDLILELGGEVTRFRCWVSCEGRPRKPRKHKSQS